MHYTSSGEPLGVLKCRDGGELMPAEVNLIIHVLGSMRADLE